METEKTYYIRHNNINIINIVYVYRYIVIIYYSKPYHIHYTLTNIIVYHTILFFYCSQKWKFFKQIDIFLSLRIIEHVLKISL